MKIKIKYLFIMFLFLIPIKVSASSVTLSVSCPQAATAGQTITCTISTNNSGDINGISAQYKFTGGATYVNFVASGSYPITNIKNNGFQLGDGNGLASNQVLGTLSVLIPSTAQAGNKFNIGLTEVNASTKDYEDIYGSDVSATVSVLSSNADLKSLSISGANINFSAGNTYYEVSIGTYNTTITAQAADGGANVSGTGYKSLNEGKNTIYIVVTAPSGAKKTYTLVINTPVTPKPQPQPKPEPQPSPSVENQNSQDNQQTTPAPTPEEPKKDSNTNLKKLSLDIAVLAFDKNKTNYELSVDNNISKVTIEAIAESDKAIITGAGEHELVVGSNVINIVVTAENGYFKIYEIIIVREKEVVISNSNKILALKINGLNFDFDPEKNEYDITTEFKSLDFKIDLFDENSSYKISGNTSLITGSEVRIRITDAEGNINIYKLHITVPEKSNEIKIFTEEKVSYMPVIIISSLLVLIIGGTIIYLIIKKRKDSKEELYEIVELKPMVNEEPEVLEMETKEIPVVTETKVIEQPKVAVQTDLQSIPQPAVQTSQPVQHPKPVVHANQSVSQPIAKPVVQANQSGQQPKPVVQPQTKQVNAKNVVQVQSKPVTQPRPVQQNVGESVMPVSTPPPIIKK